MTPRSYSRTPRPFPAAGRITQVRIIHLFPWHCGLPVLVLSLANLCATDVGPADRSRAGASSGSRVGLPGRASRSPAMSTATAAPI